MEDAWLLLPAVFLFFGGPFFLIHLMYSEETGAVNIDDAAAKIIAASQVSASAGITLGGTVCLQDDLNNLSDAVHRLSAESKQVPAKKCGHCGRKVKLDGQGQCVSCGAPEGG